MTTCQKQGHSTSEFVRNRPFKLFMMILGLTHCFVSEQDRNKPKLKNRSKRGPKNDQTLNVDF